MTKAGPILVISKAGYSPYPLITIYTRGDHMYNSG